MIKCSYVHRRIPVQMVTYLNGFPSLKKLYMILNHQSLLRHRSLNVLSPVEINDLETEFWLTQYGVFAVAQSPNSLLVWATSGRFHPFQLIRRVMLSMDYIFKLCLEVQKHMSQLKKPHTHTNKKTPFLCSVNHLEQYLKYLLLS